jgi:hypothetical protein
MLLYGDNKGGSTFTIRPHEAINNEDGNDLKILGGSSKPPQTVDGGNVFVSGVPGQSGGAEGDVILGHTGTSSVGNVGIGTSSPDANLMVSSDAGQTEPLFKVASSTNDPLASINSDGVLELSYKTDTSQVVIGNGASSASQDAVAIGRDANVGGNGVVIGDEAGSDSAGNLTAIGKAAGDGSSNTGYSVAIGREAMRSGTGNQVTAIGGYEPADGNSGDHVIAVGYRALLNNSGDENIGIGENTLRGTNYSGSIAIGYNASTTASNQLTIGSDTDNNGEITEARIGANTQDSFPLIYANRTGLGLGTTSPSNRLQADGTANITGTTTLATDGGNVRVGAAADVDFSDVGSSMIIGEGSTATGQNSLAVGSNASSSGDFSLAVGGDPDTNKGPVASGIGSAAIGYTDQGLIKASGDGSFAWGYDGTEDVDPFLTIKSTGDGAMAGGRAKGGSIDAAGAGSIALGYSEGSGILADGRGAVALGQDVTAEKQNSISLGKNFTNTATSTFALGYGSQQFTLDGTSGNVGIGTSTNLASVLTVSATSSASSANLQEWRDSNGTTNLAVSDAGQLTNPQYTNALVLGEVPDTSGASNSVILGPSNSDAGRNTQNSVFIGGGQSIDGEANWTTAIGSDISINNSGSNGNVVVGNNISTQGDWGITIGPEASGMGESIVLGTVASADKNNQFVVGSTDNSGEITEAKIGVNKQQPYPLIYADTTGLGLGTTDPTFRLDADGDINLTDGNAYRYAGNDFAQASTTQNGTVVGIKAANDGKHVGENETFVGYAAGDGSKVDSQNYTAIGAEALRYANNNSDNTAVGRQAGYKFTRDNATMIGVKAGGSRSGGNNLVAVGKKAANNNSVGASDNVAIGYKALENNSYSSSIGIGSYASTTAANQLVIGSDTSANGEITEARIGANTQDSYPLIYANRTGVGIGTTSPSVALSASGTISQANATNCTLEASASGDIICSTSDENLKTDKQTIDNALDRLTRLDGYTYEFRNQDRFGDGEQIGFMAQDVERVFPQLVRDTGEYKTLDYGNMTAVLAEAIKEINSKVETAASSSINAVGDFVKNGVARFKKLIADNVVAEKDVRAGERICIDGECLDKSDVRTLINIAESHNDATTSEDVSGNSPILDSRSEDQEQEDNAQDKADYNQTSTTTDSTEGDTNPSTQESGTSTSATTSPDTVSTTTQQTNTTDGDTKQATSSAQTDLANDTSDEETDEMQTNTTSSSTISSNKTEDGKDTGNTSSEPAEVDGNNSKQDNTESETGTTTTTNQ